MLVLTILYIINIVLAKHAFYTSIIAGIMICFTLCPVVYYNYRYKTYPSYYDIYNVKLSEILVFQTKRVSVHLQSCTGSSLYQEMELFSFDPMATFTPMTSNRNIIRKLDKIDEIKIKFRTRTEF